MGSRQYRGWSGAMGEEDDAGEPVGTTDETASGSPTEPDYAFEGYSVEFIDKVALMPITMPQEPTATAQWRRRR